MNFKQLRIGSILWLIFLYCMAFLVIYFYMSLFTIVIAEQLGYDLFSVEAGALCHVICSTVGSAAVLYLGVYTQEMNLKDVDCIKKMGKEKDQNTN